MAAAAAFLPLKFPHGMYELEPIAAPRLAAPPPDVLYRMPNLHLEAEAPPSDDRAAVGRLAAKRSAEEMSALERRQAALLTKLETLRTRMRAALELIESSRRSPEATAKRKTPQLQGGSSENLPCDVVVNASPNCLPFSLLKLKRELNSRIDCHVHSSVTELPPSARQFSERLAESNPKKADFVLTLIWKNVPSSVELVLPSSPIVVRGEANVVRYLLAATSSSLRYKDDPRSWEIDSALDLCHGIQMYKSGKERQTLMKSLERKLSTKGKWMLGADAFSAADLVAWSVVKQLRDQSDVKGNLKEWLKRCDEFVNSGR